MIPIFDFVSIVPLLFMSYIQIVKIFIPVSQVPKEQKRELNEKLQKEHGFTTLIFTVDYIACLWFVAALVYQHNYQVDAWHSTEALWLVKFISTYWAIRWLDIKGYLKFRKNDDSTKSKK